MTSVSKAPYRTRSRFHLHDVANEVDFVQLSQRARLPLTRTGPSFSAEKSAQLGWLVYIKTMIQKLIIYHKEMHMGHKFTTPD